MYLPFDGKVRKNMRSELNHAGPERRVISKKKKNMVRVVFSHERMVHFLSQHHPSDCAARISENTPRTLDSSICADLEASTHDPTVGSREGW